MSNFTFDAPIDVYVNEEYKETVTRRVIHRLATPYARYEKQWHELYAVQRGDMIHLSIIIERRKDNATT